MKKLIAIDTNTRLETTPVCPKPITLKWIIDKPEICTTLPNHEWHGPVKLVDGVQMVTYQYEEGHWE